MKSLRSLFVVLSSTALFASIAAAQQLPASPSATLAEAKLEPSAVPPAMASPMFSPSPRPITPVAPLAVAPIPKTKEPTHRFFDTANTAAFVITSGIRAADAAYTCSMMSTPGFRERWLPVKSCAGVSAWLAATQATQLGGTYLAHRMGHHRWERLVPYVWAAPSAAGIAYTFTHQ